MTEKFVLKNLKHKPYGGASSVISPEMLAQTYQFINDACVTDCLSDIDVQDRFTSAYTAWIKASRINILSNLDLFPVAAYSNGTTEAFDKFYLANKGRKFRCFRGEYMYHMASWKNICPDWQYIDDADLTENNAVVISMPFSDTGDVHISTEEVLNTCDRLKIPVLIDCAFIGICGGINFDFDHPCITDISFSLSKTFPVANLRIGMRLSRTDNDDSLLVHKKTNYTNRLGAAVGLSLMNMFSVDYNFTRWQAMQKDFCKQLGVEPSKSVIFGIATDKFEEYNRGGPTSRLCFAKWLYEGQLPHD